MRALFSVSSFVPCLWFHPGTSPAVCAKPCPWCSSLSGVWNTLFQQLGMVLGLALSWPQASNKTAAVSACQKPCSLILYTVIACAYSRAEKLLPAAIASRSNTWSKIVALNSKLVEKVCSKGEKVMQCLLFSHLLLLFWILSSLSFSKP